MFFCKVSVLIVALSICRGQEYDFGAEISRQCLVPDPVGLLDCVENKVTLPYLTSWVDCTNSLGQNVRTSADIINYRCKSVWEGKGVIPEVFYIKDCVIEKTGLPAKNVSAEVLGAYKECESSPKPQIQQALVTNSGIKTAQIQQQQIDTSGYRQTSQPMPPAQPILQAPRPFAQTIPPAPQLVIPAPRPPVQQPFSQQFFVLYPTASLPVQQQVSVVPISANQQQQLPTASYAPQTQQISQQQLTFPITQQQQIPASSYVPQTQQVSQQRLSSFSTAHQQLPPSFTPLAQAQPSFGSVPNNAYYYGFQIQHPQHSIKI